MCPPARLPDLVAKHPFASAVLGYFYFVFLFVWLEEYSFTIWGLILDFKSIWEYFDLLPWGDTVPQPPRSQGMMFLRSVTISGCKISQQCGEGPRRALQWPGNSVHRTRKKNDNFLAFFCLAFRTPWLHCALSMKGMWSPIHSCTSVQVTSWLISSLLDLVRGFYQPDKGWQRGQLSTRSLYSWE